MADKTVRTGFERQRFKTLAQAALNADLTVQQLEALTMQFQKDGACDITLEDSTIHPSGEPRGTVMQQ